jgi:hypothetical protein
MKPIKRGITPAEWQRRRSFLFGFFQACFLVCALFWTPFHGWLPFALLPPPGYAVAVIAVAAALMSIQGGMKKLQKAVWMVVIGLFLVVELRSIKSDRADSEAKALQAKKNADAAFAEVLRTEHDNFASTAKGIKATMDGVELTLKQTHPHAYVHFSTFLFENPPSPGNSILKGISYRFRNPRANEGNEAATIQMRLTKFYIGKPDDKSSEIELAKQFEKDWVTAYREPHTPSALEPNTPRYFTEYRTFSDDEIDGPQSLSKGYTIYVFRRIAYTDSTGRWFTDDCADFQRDQGGGIYVHVTHPCEAFTQSRHPAK